MSQELTRNDIAAFTLFKKMMTRLMEARETAELQQATISAQISQFAQLNGLTNGIQYVNTTSQAWTNAQLAQLQYASLAGQAMAAHSHSVSSPGNMGYITNGWVPRMTPAEFDVFSAYMNGEDVVLHVLSDQRD